MGTTLKVSLAGLQPKLRGEDGGIGEPATPQGAFIAAVRGNPWVSLRGGCPYGIQKLPVCQSPCQH